MIELLKLCGFEPDEIDSQLPRIEKVFNKIGVTDEDIERGKQRLNKYYDMELQGVRKLFRFYILGLAEAVLAREEGKEMIIYSLMSPGTETMGAALMTKSSKVLVSNPPTAFCVVVGAIFGKLAPILEAAERVWLKAGAVAHCANQKLYVGLLALGLIPKPDILAACEFLCDSAPKTADLLQELWDVPTFSYGTCKDMETMDDPNVSNVTSLAVKDMRRLAERLQDMAGIEITDDMLWEVMNAQRDVGEASLKLDTLIAGSDPLPISSTHNMPFYRLNMASFGIDDIPSQVDAINTLYEEVQERVSKGYAAVEKGAPRIFCIMPPHESDPRMDHLLGELGIANVASENRLYPPDGRRSPDRERPKDPYEAMFSNILYSSMYQTPKARIPAIIGFCKRLNIDGVLARYHAGCRSAALDAMVIKSAITKELGIPVLVLEWESFDPRAYNHEQYKRRFEVFKLMMRPS